MMRALPFATLFAVLIGACDGKSTPSLRTNADQTETSPTQQVDRTGRPATRSKPQVFESFAWRLKAQEGGSGLPTSISRIPMKTFAVPTDGRVSNVPLISAAGFKCTGSDVVQDLRSVQVECFTGTEVGFTVNVDCIKQPREHDALSFYLSRSAGSNSSLLSVDMWCEESLSR